MQYKCDFCNDTGSLDQDEYLNCAHCGAADERVALNSFVRSLGVNLTLDERTWAIHQRAIAMAPKQEAPAPYAWVNAGIERRHPEYATLSVGPENPWIDSANAFPVYAAPAVANGALPELPKPETMIVESDLGHRAYSADQMRAYGKACAAAGPDDELAEDAMRYRFLRDVDPDAEDPAIMMHVKNDWGNWSYISLSGDDADQAIDAALAGAKGN